MNPKQAQRIAKHFTSNGAVRLDGQRATLYRQDDGTDAEVVAIIELPCMGLEPGATGPLYQSGYLFMQALRAAGPSGLIAGIGKPDPVVCGVQAIPQDKLEPFRDIFRKADSMLPDTNPVAEFTVPLDRLIAAASMRAVGDIRRYLCGVMVDHKRGRVIGCDGHVLGLANGDTVPHSETGLQYVVPGCAVDLILATKATEWALVPGPGKPPGYLIAASDEVAILVSCTSQKYPDIDRVMPDTTTRRRIAAVNDPQLLARQLLDAARRGNAINPDSKMPVAALLTHRRVEKDDDWLDVTVPILNDGQVLAKLPAVWFDVAPAENFRIAFNAQLLAKALLHAPLGASIFLATDNESIRIQSGWLDAVVMPMRQ